MIAVAELAEAAVVRIAEPPIDQTVMESLRLAVVAAAVVQAEGRVLGQEPAVEVVEQALVAREETAMTTLLTSL